MRKKPSQRRVFWKPGGDVEPLEARIAPAVIFLHQAGATEIVGGQELDANNEGAATEAGSALALLLSKGDQLYFDEDGNPATTSDNVLLANVRGGRGLIYVNDLDGDQSFSANEITGLLVSHRFRGAVMRDVHGSVVTGLTATGDIGTGEGSMDVAGLSVQGRVEGSILASGKISKIDIQTPDGDNYPSVQLIATGNAAEGVEYSVNGKTTQEFSSTASGATNITQIHLTLGANEIHAGDGVRGGDVSKVTIDKAVTAITITAGNANERSGGAGGKINKVAIESALDDLDFSFTAGNGSMGKTKAGPGGSITTLSLGASDAPSFSVGTVTLTAGSGGSFNDDGGGVAAASAEDGGDESFETIANGGSGGGVEAVIIVARGAVDVAITGGNGGTGGEIHHESETFQKTKLVPQRDDEGHVIRDEYGVIQYDEEPVVRQVPQRDEYGKVVRDEYGHIYYDEVPVYVTTKAVDKGGSGGAGGRISDVTLTVLEGGTADFTGGAGGHSGMKTAGSGGSVSDIEATGTDVFNGTSGAGGSGEYGGTAGSVSSVTLDKLGVGGEVTLVGGVGGAGASRHGSAGSISKISISSAEEVGAITLTAGDGAGADNEETESGAQGGTGGSVSGLTIQVHSLETLDVTAGQGGAGSSMTIYTGDSEDPYGGGEETTVGGAGGAGGTISMLSLRALEGDAAVTLHGGNGGAGAADQHGGSGGTVSNVIAIENVGTVSIAGGTGGAAGESGGQGGAGGGVKAIKSIVAHDEVSIRGGDGGDGQGGWAGGAGASLAKITVELHDGTLELTAGVGGQGSFVEEVTEPKMKRVAQRDEYGHVVRDEYGHIYYDEVQVTKLVPERDEYGALVRDEYGKVVFDEIPVYSTVSPAKSGAGGAGGNISKASLTALESGLISFAATAGGGGTGGGPKAGGAGGNLRSLTVTAQGIDFDNFVLHAGAGGDGDDSADGDEPTSLGGGGGSITKILMHVDDALNGVAEVIAGNGGAGGKAVGVGGDVLHVILQASEAFSPAVSAGDSGDESTQGKVDDIVISPPPV